MNFKSYLCCAGVRNRGNKTGTTEKPVTVSVICELNQSELMDQW